MAQRLPERWLRFFRNAGSPSAGQVAHSGTDYSVSEEIGNYSRKVTLLRYYFKYVSQAIRSTPMIGEILALELRKIVLDNDYECDETTLSKLSEYGYIVDGKPNISVFTSEYEKKDTDIRLIDLWSNLTENILEFMKFYSERIKRDIPDHLKNDKVQLQNAFRGFPLRGAVIEEALRNGYISHPDKDDRKMLGAYLMI